MSSRAVAFFALAFAGVAWLPAPAAVADDHVYRVKDIDPAISSNPSSSPTELVVAAGVTYFRAEDERGVELWRSDGTASGTYLLRDINPGASSSDPTGFTQVSDLVFFVANDGTNGAELWRTDGTPEGTVLVKDVFPGATSSQAGALVAYGDVVMFRATDGVHGVELWRSDGTEAGTFQVKDVRTGSNSSFPAQLVTAAGRVFFVANTALGTELWSSDGTDAGTALVKDIRPGDLSPALSSLTRAGDRVFFVANDGTTGAELWTSDGTEGGTVLVRDIVPGLSGSGIPALTALGSRVFFQANDLVTGTELWTTDGTLAGTVLVKDILPGPTGSRPENLTAAFGRVYFEAQDATHGRELWASDGTLAGTVLVADVLPGVGAGGATEITPSGTSVFFVARTTPLGRELWKTDGTTAGTALVRDIRPGSLDSGAASLVDEDGLLLFAATDGAAGQELWRSDGTTAGTALVKDLRTGTQSGAPGSFAGLGSRVLFAAAQGGDRELWSSDGTEAGTSLLKDIRPGNGSSAPAELTLSNGRIFFSATTQADGTELWTSDGTEAGTVLVRDLAPGQANGSPGGFVDLSGTLLFAATTTAGRELWRSDGTLAGTVLVRDIAAGTGSSNPSLLTRAGDLVFFVATDATSGRELWRTDGTLAGTVRVSDIAPGPSSSSPSELVAVGSRVFFAANDGTRGVELWTSDGTAAGTVMVADLNPKGSSSPTGLVALGGRVYFAASDGVSGTELWASDGTLAGTAMVVDLRPGAAGSKPRLVTVSNGLLYLSADDGVSGRELWKSDGTAAGTVLVDDIAPGPAASDPTALRDVNGTLLFRAQDPVFGAEPWTTDGTAAGTKRLRDVNPGDGSSEITSFTPAAGGQVFFAANDGTSGLELWAIRNQSPRADAGADQTIELGAPVVLDGSLSNDPDGDALSYDWRDAAERSVGTTAQTSLTLPLGSHSFSLTVRDGFGGAATDSVTVSVQDTRAPAVGVIAPRNVTLVAGIATTVSWKAEDNGSLRRFDVFFSADGGNTFAPLQGCTDLAGDVFACSFTPSLPAAPKARLRVEARDGAGNMGADEASFAIVAPTLVLTAPNGPLTWAPGTAQNITWTGNLPTATSLRIELSRGAGANFVTLAEAAPNSGSLAWLVTGPSTASALVRISWTGGDASDVSDAPFTINRSPSAQAGPDQTGELGVPVLFDGGASFDPDGDPLSFRWTDEHATLLGTTAQIAPTLPTGAHLLTLTVSDAFGGSAQDVAGLKVIHTTSLTLTVTGQNGGTGSVAVDPPGASCDNQASDATCTFTYTTEPTVTLLATPAADSDFKGWSGACSGLGSCTVAQNENRTVGALFRHQNRAPLAVAQGPASGPRNVALAFDGSSSSDVDGDALTWAWDFGDGTTATGAAPHHAYVALGDYTVTLVVNDGVLSSAPAALVVRVVNRPPVANAGPDVVGELGASVSLLGAGSDPDGDALTYEWRDEAGALVATTPNLSLVLPLGAHVLTLTVRDGPGASAADSAVATVVDTTPPGVALLVPPGGFDLLLDVAASVSWAASDNGALAGFDLLVSSDGGASFAAASGCAGLPATATSCIWANPGPVTTTGRLRLVARDAAGNTAFAEAPLTVTAPTLAVTSPAPGTSWGTGSIQTVTFATNLGPGATFRIELSRDGGLSFEVLAGSVQASHGTTGSFDWVVTGPPTTSAVLRVVWNERPELTATNAETFVLAAPFINLGLPNGAEIWAVGSVQTATWTHNLGAKASFRIELSRNGGTTWSLLASGVPSTSRGSGAYDWLVSGPGTTRARMRVTWTANSATSDRSDASFVIR